MEQLAELGRAFSQLRSLLGLSIDACASRIDLPAERLAAAERGDLALEALRDIARLYALDEDALREGMVMPVPGLSGATVFLLHGDYQDFDARDLSVLDRAMRAARSMTACVASTDEAARLRRRLQFVPVSPAGPRPVDAARQGHKLARWVRAKIHLGGEPAPDMRVLLEEQLGIAVVVDNLVSTNLRAASILDAHRAAAAALLAHPDPDRERNPALARVYLAHELCHLLFDPGAPGSVRMALDDRPEDGASRAGAGASGAVLLESRAKGFAAEFLIPLEGVTALLGALPGDPVRSLGVARDMVAQVRDRFGTPWEIATYHLRNLGFIQNEFTLDLLRQVRPPSVQSVTSLPAVGTTSLVLADLLAGHLSPEIAAELTSTKAEVAPVPPWYVGAAQRAVMAAIDGLTTSAIDAASLAIASGRETEAVDLLVEYFDDLFLAGEFDAARRALARLDPRQLPPKVLTGLLMVSAHAREELGDARADFFVRVQAALAHTWQLHPEAIDAIVRRLR